MVQQINIPTSNYRLKVCLNIFSTKGQSVTVTGFDAKHTEIVYFNTDIDLNAGDNAEYFCMPLTPEDLLIQIQGDAKVVIEAIKTEAYPEKQLGINSDNQKYLEYLEWFATVAGYSPTGEYTSPDGKVYFNYMNLIEAEPQTPARVDHESREGEVQWAKKHIQHYTVPMIIAVGMHERTHWYTGTKDESEADLSGAKICLDRGYPSNEILHASTRILEGVDRNGRPIHRNIERALAIKNLIENYKG